MNAEIGAYQPDDWDGERQYDPFVSTVRQESLSEVVASTNAPLHA